MGYQRMIFGIVMSFYNANFFGFFLSRHKNINFYELLLTINNLKTFK